MSHYLGAGLIVDVIHKVLEKYGAEIIFIVSQQEGNLDWLNEYFQVLRFLLYAMKETVL